MIYLQLFLSMFQIGLFSVGGGYVAIPLIQHQVVELHGWLTATEFTDIITIAEMTPGPIAINSATFVGIRVAGIPGALVATFGCVLPSCCIVLVLARIYYKYRSLEGMRRILSGLRPAVVGMIASAGLSILLLALFAQGRLPQSPADLNLPGVLIFAAALVGLRRFRLSPLRVMAGAGLAGLILYPLLGL